jgi:hypothetical protein
MYLCSVKTIFLLPSCVVRDAYHAKGNTQYEPDALRRNTQYDIRNTILLCNKILQPPFTKSSSAELVPSQTGIRRLKFGQLIFYLRQKQIILIMVVLANSA